MGIDLSTLEARKALAQKYAAKYALDPSLVAAVCEQESGWNPWSMRYEPAFYQRYISGMTGLTSTEMQARATSFGLMQTMGQVAREFGFTGKWISELCDPDVGVDIGCRKLAKCLANHPNDVEAALLAYNGGGNPSYGAEVMARMATYA